MSDEPQNTTPAENENIQAGKQNLPLEPADPQTNPVSNGTGISEETTPKDGQASIPAKKYQCLL